MSTLAPLSEKQFQQQIIDLARVLGWMVYHTFDARKSTPGFPDLVMVRDDDLIFAELKTQKGRMGPGQSEWLNALACVAERVKAEGDRLRFETGGGIGLPAGRPHVEVYLWRPPDWGAIETRLKQREPLDIGRRPGDA